MPSTFERAVDALVNGDITELAARLNTDPSLIAERSERPHRATLLHYIAANGVEDERQRTPPNILAITELLLAHGPDVDALAEMYGGQHTAMTMLVSSGHPAKAGVQADLVKFLLDAGAAIEGVGSGTWGTPLITALAFGYRDTAEFLATKGARTDSLPAAAGLGRLEEVHHLLPTAPQPDRRIALALAAQHGHAEIVEALLSAGEDPNTFNPPGFHAHSTPLHQAALNGHTRTVEVLLHAGAKRDIKDTVFHATPAGWANHGRHQDLARLLER